VIYLVLVLSVGIVVMLGELALGRKTGKGAVGTYVSFSKKHVWLGYAGVLSGFLIFAFYSVLGGMVMRYMIGYLLKLLGVARLLRCLLGLRAVLQRLIQLFSVRHKYHLACIYWYVTVSTGAYALFAP
jgi:SNF family Na+-dependent transporter